ncbi:hypothetical protein Misp01_70390 [Microtetraspora sp. NBRC 13810]|uniref:hypothetical protein n=1 Tax=Microtetraspora sp. NBRC 13810 TaxID=3030990 RepID=UPI0024A36E6D|nr:hypothetical protein [Microtetraspora sp. NBRC 13810]GLW11911.1 hypothetical protein Misp01_70390 [Microtetraspora sp. NBRC 13810]
MAINARRLTLATAAILISEIALLPLAGAYATVAPQSAAGWWTEPPPSFVRDSPSIARSNRGYRNQNFTAVNSATIQRGRQNSAVSIGQNTRVQSGSCKHKRFCKIIQKTWD